VEERVRTSICRNSGQAVGRAFHDIISNIGHLSVIGIKYARLELTSIQYPSLISLSTLKW
jgi:hypothetical protein